jgi:NDP-sugar pyrophosphorylase family protein
MIAILLCGGKGERLRPLTLDVPKPMVKIKNKPIISYILNQINNPIIHKIYITVGYKAEIIEEYFKENFLDQNIEIINNGDVDIIDRILSAVNLNPEENEFLIMYGDTISNVNLNNLHAYSKHIKEPGVITIWPLSTSFGVVEIDNDNNVIGFKEKPRLDKWINIGYFILKKDILKFLHKFSKFEDYLQFCGENNFFKAYKHEGEHYTVNTIVELDIVEKNINKIIN